MIIPNKIVSFEHSILGKSRYILSALNREPSNLQKIFTDVRIHFEDINEFVLALDVLFSLDYISLTEANEVYRNA